MEALANLGIDWKLLLAQAVNFLVLLFILRRFAYKPMLDFLEKRSTRIEQGLKDAEAAQTKLAAMEAKEKETLSVARNEARAIIDAAETSAKKRDAERLAETEAQTKRFLEDARIKIEAEKQKILVEARQEIAEVVALSVEKILRETVDAKVGKKIIETRIRP
ncbi:MAG: F0F1 ATP synthase subunit B [Candidatus Moraniibacteriota bacterium]